MGGTQSSGIPKPSVLKYDSQEEWDHWKHCFEDYYRGRLHLRRQREKFYHYAGSVGKEILEKLYLEDPKSAIAVQTLLFKFDVYFKYREITKDQDQSIDNYVTYLQENISGFGSYSTQEVIREKVLQDMVSDGLVVHLHELNIKQSSLSMLTDIWKSARENGGVRRAPPAPNNLQGFNAGNLRRVQSRLRIGHEQIPHNSTGHSYKSVFGNYMDENVTWIQIDEPYLIEFYQLQNFLRFCELARKQCRSLSTISLTTKRDSSGKSDQTKKLDELTKTLADHGITLRILYSDTLHDRQIKLSTGCVIKIGRGLHYFKPHRGNFSLGYYDLDLRPCIETSVDIYQEN